MLFNVPLSSRSVLVSLSAVAVILPVVSLVVVQAVVSRHIATSSTKKRVLSRKDRGAASSSASADSAPPNSLPDNVLETNAPYVVMCERVVSRPIPISTLTLPSEALSSSSLSGPDKTGSLLTAYLRGTMEAFSWTPQGILIRRMFSSPPLRRTFDADYIHSLKFVTGDLADGAYQVTFRGRVPSGDGSRERAELFVMPVPDRPDLVVHAIIVTEVEVTATEVVFVNETWMWRHIQDEKPSMLESAFGRWLHSLVGGWMIFKGTRAVTGPIKDKAE